MRQRAFWGLVGVGVHGRLMGDLVGRCRLEGGGLGSPPRKMGRAADLKPSDLRGLWIELFRIVGFLLVIRNRRLGS